MIHFSAYNYSDAVNSLVVPWHYKIVAILAFIPMFFFIGFMFSLIGSFMFFLKEVLFHNRGIK
jgi:hypothetical protein